MFFVFVCLCLLGCLLRCWGVCLFVCFYFCVTAGQLLNIAYQNRALFVYTQSPEEKSNKVRVAVGNSLGGDIWSEVMQRFNIGRILETYGATEANFGIMNVDNKIGSVGCWPPLLRVNISHSSIYPITYRHPGAIYRACSMIPTNPASPMNSYVQNSKVRSNNSLCFHTDIATTRNIVYPEVLIYTKTNVSPDNLITLPYTIFILVYNILPTFTCYQKPIMIG